MGSFFSRSAHERRADAVDDEDQRRFHCGDQEENANYPEGAAVSGDGVQHELVRTHDGQGVFADPAGPFPRDTVSKPQHEIRPADAADEIQQRTAQNAVIKAVTERELKADRRGGCRQEKRAADLRPAERHQLLFKQVSGQHEDKAQNAAEQ